MSRFYSKRSRKNAKKFVYSKRALKPQSNPMTVQQPEPQRNWLTVSKQVLEILLVILQIILLFLGSAS